MTNNDQCHRHHHRGRKYRKFNTAYNCCCSKQANKQTTTQNFVEYFGDYDNGSEKKIEMRVKEKATPVFVRF